MPPTDYRDPEGRRPDLLSDITADRPLDVAAVRPWPFPAFEDALRAGLAHEPERRGVDGDSSTELRVLALKVADDLLGSLRREVPLPSPLASGRLGLPP
ncbi:hypothetical protein ACIG5E_38795 [Kitasatospora sp. NPDC053057]|uniref:hypothetical protein n=1 Tax=Kitasatospora sp. NPDC053057 TaxID=3364062 RepID=UPI0037C869F7